MQMAVESFSRIFNNSKYLQEGSERLRLGISAAGVTDSNLLLNARNNDEAFAL